MALKVQIQGFLISLLLYVSVCDGSTTTKMTPSGYEEGKAGDLIAVNCTFPSLPGNLVLEFNGVESSLLDERTHPGEGERDSGCCDSQGEHIRGEFGPNSAQTGLVIQLKFNLTADHNGSTLRCKFDSTASADDSSESEYLRLTVLYCVSENPKLFALYGATTTGILLWFLLAAVPLLRCLSATAPLIRFWFSVAVRLSVAMETHHSAFNGMFLLQIRSVYWISARQLQCILQHQSNWQRMQ
eukprot:m.186946 g.186946  ORF g.186946 m.186946 type:complete len:242 (+) comp39357_c1_seq22:330-1055(+)